MNKLSLLTLFFAMIAPFTARAADPTGKELMESVENREEGKDEMATVTLEVKPERGTARVRRFTYMRKTYDEDKKYVTFFLAPPDVRNAGFLSWDRKKGDDRRWLYLPSIGQIRRLTTGDERTSFFGTDIVYEDITNRDPGLDTHTLVGSEKHKDFDCWVVESVAKDPSSVEFSKYKSWVWKTAPVVVKQDFYDASDKVERELEILDFTNMQGIWARRHATVSNLKTHSKTRIQFDDVKYNIGLPDEAFSEHQLSRGLPSL